MSRKAARLLERARRSSAGWMPRDLASLYRGFGFEIREGKGSHKVVSHPDHKHLMGTFTNHPKELGRGYVEHAVKLIDELLKIQKEQKKDERDN